MLSHAIEVALKSFIGYARVKEPAAPASGELENPVRSPNGRSAAFSDLAPRH
jgi:hypothetical protein